MSGFRRSASTTHLLAYYRWDQRARWKLDSLERGALAYVSYERKLWPKYAAPGSILWVVGLGPDDTPTLEASFEIARTGPKGVDGRAGLTAQGAAGDGRFYGLNDASAAMMELVFTGSRGNWTLAERAGTEAWDSTHGKYLQAPRRLAAPGETTPAGRRSAGSRPLTRLADRASESSLFLSWKHRDNDADRRRFLRDLAIGLAKRGFSVWLDLLALGEADDVEKRPDKDELMDRLLRQGLEQCRAVLGVWTPAYGTPSEKDGVNWTRREWSGSGEVRRVALVPEGDFESKEGMADPDVEVAMPAGSPADRGEAVADRIARGLRES